MVIYGVALLSACFLAGNFLVIFSVLYCTLRQMLVV